MEDNSKEPEDDFEADMEKELEAEKNAAIARTCPKPPEWLDLKDALSIKLWDFVCVNEIKISELILLLKSFSSGKRLTHCLAGVRIVAEKC